MSTKLILASTPDGIIGKDGDLPWKLRSDLIHFKSLTDGHPIVMGRKTYESLPGVLPNRLHIVVTGNPHKVNVSGDTVIVPTLGMAHVLATSHSRHNGDYFVIGGARLYDTYLSLIGRSNDKSPSGISEIWWTRVEMPDKEKVGEFTRIDTSLLNKFSRTDPALQTVDQKDESETFVLHSEVRIGKDKHNDYPFTICRLTKDNP